MKPFGRIIWIGLCAVTAVATLSLITPTFARYSNTASTAVTFGRTDILLGQTLSADTEIYDFGVYSSDADENEFTHTVRIRQSAPVSGVLRFSFDDTTRSNKDIAVYVDSRHYTAVQNRGYTDYTVSAADGDLQIPFSLLFSSPTARVAVLDVSWYPDEGDEPTLFARYLLTVADEDATGTAPAFVAENTAFLSDRLLQVEVATPADHAGVQLSPVAGAFAVGTRYYNAACATGATLLRDSSLFVPREGDSTLLYVDLSAHLSDNNPLSLRTSVSDTLSDTISCTPLAGKAALAVALSSGEGVVTADAPLTVTVTQAAALRDSDWSHTGSTPADITWQVWRREGEALRPVTVGEHLTVTAVSGATGGTITVAAPDGIQPAGGYLLVITQYYHGYPVCELPVWFFIDYQ